MKLNSVLIAAMGIAGAIVGVGKDLSNYRSACLAAKKANEPQPDYDLVLFVTHAASGFSAGVGVAMGLSNIPVGS